MARFVVRGTQLSKSLPTLDLPVLIAAPLPGFTTEVQAVLTNVDPGAGAGLVNYDVWDLTGASPVSVLTASTNVDVVGVGRYAANWAVPGTGNVGLHRIDWHATVGGVIHTWSAYFDVLAAGILPPRPSYALLSDLRTEGFDTVSLPDARALSLLKSMSVMIEKWTRRFFEPRYRSVNLDGSEGPSFRFADPIIGLDAVAIDDTSIDLTTNQIRVYNRHLVSGLLNPDDRDNPKMDFVRIIRILQRLDVYDRPYSNRAIFWPGPQNVAVSGLFGYTDPDDSWSVGITPDPIRRVTMMLVARELPQISDPDTRFDVQNSFRQKDLRTRDQSVSFGPGRSDLVLHGGMDFTGDPSIDDIIDRYVAPPYVGSP